MISQEIKIIVKYSVAYSNETVAIAMVYGDGKLLTLPDAKHTSKIMLCDHLLRRWIGMNHKVQKSGDTII